MMISLEFILIGILIILGGVNFVLLHLAASYASRVQQAPYPLDVFVGLLEVYSAFWSGRSVDASARRVVWLQYGCVLAFSLVLVVLVGA